MGKKYAMDRIFSEVKKINDDWTRLNQDLQELALIRADNQLKEFFTRSDVLRNKFANIITFGENGIWRIMAQANGVALDEEAIVSQFAELCIKSLDPDLYSILADEIIPALKFGRKHEDDPTS